MKIKRLIKIAIVIGVGGIFGPRIYTTLSTHQDIYLLENVPAQETAIIFGAAVRRDGLPSAALRVRIQAGVDLYNEEIVSTLIMSGSEPEPEAMKQWAIDLGVPEEDILIDNDGQRSYNTCASAAINFGLTKAIVVTQQYHLPRTIFLCNAWGVESVGFAATDTRYWRGAMITWNIRETLATGKAMWDVYVSPPQLTFAD
jgi:SanA protein